MRVDEETAYVAITAPCENRCSEDRIFRVETDMLIFASARVQFALESDTSIDLIWLCKAFALWRL